MAWDSDAQRAAEAQLRKLGRPWVYTKKNDGPLPDPVLVHVVRGLDTDPHGLEVEVLENQTLAIMLRSEVGRPLRGDVIEDGDESLTVDKVMTDDGFVITVAMLDTEELPGGSS